MKVQDAVTTAKTYIRNVYSDEKIVHVGLEEVVLDDSDDPTWKVTIGFSRPWDIGPKDPFEYLKKRSPQPMPMPRTYKLVIVRDSDGEVLSVKHRNLVSS